MQEKPRTLIHIGYPKTATTWLQQEFFPKLSSHRLVPREQIKEALIRPSPFEFDPQQAFQKLTGDFGDSLVLSEELLVGSIRSGGFNLMHTEQMAHRLHKSFPSASILLFIRSQPEIITSGYAQYIRDGGRETIAQYLNAEKRPQMVRLRSFNYAFLNYPEIISMYRNLFPGKVYVYLYEDFASDPAKFVSDFVRVHDLEIRTETVNYSQRNERLKNISVRRLGNRLYRLRFLSPARLTFGKVNSQSFFRKKETTQKILGEFYGRILVYYAPVNRRLVEEFGLDSIRKYNYPL